MTNRGSSNHGLIRQGQSQASVEISLYNRGENAFKPEVTFQLKPYLHVKEMLQRTWYYTLKSTRDTAFHYTTMCKIF
jgi:hypothetical protein